MSLISLSNLSIYFMGKPLFENIGFQVDPGNRIGLVGPNGSGKTTLLRLIRGELTPDSGEIRINKTARIGYLPQDIEGAFENTLLNTVIEAVPDRTKILEQINRAEQKLENEKDEEGHTRAATRLAELHQKIADLEINFPAHRAEKILIGLGFKNKDFDKPASVFSGGWKMRTALASLLHQAPDVLLLDEPTNHLDLPSVRWMESYLKDFKGALILICHDRDFLNRQTDRILSFEPEGFRSYSGNYDYYLSAREEEQKTLDAEKRKQDQKIKDAKKFIDRFRYKATKARQAQSKIKLLEKIELVKTHQSKKSIRFSFPEVSQSGRNVISIEGIAKGFDEGPLYRDIDLQVMRGERIAIVGYNGSGKTTLLKMVSGEMETDAGEIRLGHGVTMSYYAQHHSEMLDTRKTIIEEVYQAAPNESISYIRGVCGAFLFSGDTVDKSISVLSGGEKARVSLAKILLNPGNLLVMDEPTNHLDIISSEILTDALSDYNGTILFVSHNQFFVNRLATKIWDIREEAIEEYPGTLYEYLDHMALQEMEQQGMENNKIKEAQTSNRDIPQQSRITKKDERRIKAEKRKIINATLNPLKKKMSELESRIADLESKEKELETVLADPDIFSDKDKSVPLLNEYGIVKKKIEELMNRWEHNQNELDEAQKELGIE